MTARSGRNLLASFPVPGRLGSVLRTLVASLSWRSMASLLTWSPSVTPAGRLLYRLKPSAPPTGGNGSGFLPTTKDQDAKHGPSPSELQRHTPSLGALVHLLPTPNAWDVLGTRTLPPGTTPTGMTPEGKKKQVGLANAVKLLPTPRAIYGEHPGMRDTGQMTRAAMWFTPTAGDGMKHTTVGYEKRLEQGRQISLSGQVGMAAGLTKDTPANKLNSAWVSRMMGFPDDWLTLDS